MLKWHVRDKTKKVRGPYDAAEVIRQVASGAVILQVREVGSSEWKDLETHPTFAQAVAELVVRMAKPVRPAEPCKRCNGQELIRCIAMQRICVPRSDPLAAGVVGSRFDVEAVRASFRGSVEQNRNGSFRHQLDAGEGRGWLEYYVCRSCGYVEWFCLDAESIPIGPQHLTELVTVTDRGPYR